MFDSFKKGYGFTMGCLTAYLTYKVLNELAGRYNRAREAVKEEG